MNVWAQPTPAAPPTAGPYSPAVRAGDWLVLSGQLGLDRKGKLVDGGVEAQARQALANVVAILENCGASIDDVAKTTVFVTDLSVFGAVNAIYGETFDAHRPARSTVQVAALPMGAEFEIELWAYRPS